MTAEEVLNLIKNSKEDVNLAIVDVNGGVYVNDETANIMTVFNLPKENSRFYGVYGDLIPFYGQVDSVRNSDEEILQSIEKAMSLGKLKKLDEIGNIFQKAFLHQN